MAPEAPGFLEAPAALVAFAFHHPCHRLQSLLRRFLVRVRDLAADFAPAHFGLLLLFSDSQALVLTPFFRRPPFLVFPPSRVFVFVFIFHAKEPTGIAVRERAGRAVVCRRAGN